MYSTGSDGSVAHRLSTHAKDKSLTNGTPALVPLSDSALEAREFREQCKSNLGRLLKILKIRVDNVAGTY